MVPSRQAPKWPLRLGEYTTGKKEKEEIKTLLSARQPLSAPSFPSPPLCRARPFFLGADLVLAENFHFSPVPALVIDGFSAPLPRDNPAQPLHIPNYCHELAIKSPRLQPSSAWLLLAFLTPPIPDPVLPHPCFLRAATKITQGPAAMDGVNPQSRTTAAEDDGLDQIGVDSPRSGIATPQPDLHDKRLPGIMSYFNQVRASSFQRLWSGSFRTNGKTATTGTPTSASTPTALEEQLQAATMVELPPTPVEAAPWTGSSPEEPPLLAHELPEKPTGETVSPSEGPQQHSYPTPPTSQTPSLRNFTTRDSNGQHSAAITPPISRSTSLRHLSVSELGRGRGRTSSLLAPLTTVVSDSSVSARHLSNPAGRPTSTGSGSATQDTSHGDVSLESASLVNLKQTLTSTKSGTSTPRRALSSAYPSHGEGHDDTRHRNGSGIDRTATNTPTPPGAQAPAAKGKLTIKITEAKGLRKCQDPYIVVVFQRSELISSGPRPSEGDDQAAISAVVAGVPMKRQGSDSGRSMAIPMRSRQSSNTSLSDFNTFRNRDSRRSFTSPKWDAEAIL